MPTEAGARAGHDVGDRVERVERVAGLVDTDPGRACEAATALLAELLPDGTSDRAVDQARQRLSEADVATAARLLVVRGRARHFQRELAAHDDTAAALR